jgi:hypothetical protein
MVASPPLHTQFNPVLIIFILLLTFLTPYYSCSSGLGFFLFSPFCFVASTAFISSENFIDFI